MLLVIEKMSLKIWEKSLMGVHEKPKVLLSCRKFYKGPGWCGSVD